MKTIDQRIDRLKRTIPQARARKKRKQIVRTFKYKQFSAKQLKVLTWWTDVSPYHDADGVIADGSIRSGKTMSMSLSYVMWAMETFDGENFIMAGKTIGSFRRNVVTPLKIMLRSRGYEVEDSRADNILMIFEGSRFNYFHIFGGKDEGSQDLVQGLTAAGAFFDEVALMPESFVNQATGRCSVDGSKLWFNCNPDGPMHWFKRNWIDKNIFGLSDEEIERRKAQGEELKNLLYLHFTMDDNLSLSEKIKARYRSWYTGVFYLRYILGVWAVAEGLIYTSFTDDNLYDDEDMPVWLKSTAVRTISIDYGTHNPCVFLEIWDDGETLWVDNEYRWDSTSDIARRRADPQKTCRHLWAIGQTSNAWLWSTHPLPLLSQSCGAVGYMSNLRTIPSRMGSGWCQACSRREKSGSTEKDVKGSEQSSCLMYGTTKPQSAGRTNRSSKETMALTRCAITHIQSFQAGGQERGHEDVKA